MEKFTSSNGDNESRPSSTRPRTGIYYGYVIVSATFVIWFVNWGLAPSYGVFFKPILEEFNWTRAMTAGAYSLSSGIIGLIGIIAGRLTQRFGPRAVILILGSFLGIGLILMSRINELWQFYLVYGLIIGIGLGCVTVPSLITVARWFVKRRGLMSGLVQAGGGIGGMVIPTLAGWLILTRDWRHAYIILGIVALVLMITAGVFLRYDPRDKGLLPYGIDEKAKTETKREQTPHGADFSFQEAISRHQFWVLALMLFAFGFVRSTTLVHIAAHATDQGLSLAAGATIIAIISGGSIIGRVGMGRLADAMGNRRIFVIGFALVSAALFWIALQTGDPWTLYLFAVVFGIGWGSLAAVRMPLIAGVFGLGSLGTIMGATEFSSQIGAIIGPLIAGWIYDTANEYTLAFIVTGGIGALGLIMTIFLRPIRRQRPLSSL